MPNGKQSRGAVRVTRQTLSFIVIATVAVLGGAPWGHNPVQAFLGRKAPEVTSQVWINSDPLSLQGLKGKVALVEFWTFGCFNCRNVEPKVKEWHQRYADKGLVVIGIHSPEFSYEKNVAAVREYVRTNGIHYPVAIDNEFVNWDRYGNRYWPCMYLIDKQGVIRYLRAGEGGYGQTEQVIQNLLAEQP